MSTKTNVIEFVVKGTVPPSGGGTRQFWNVFHYRLATGTLDTRVQLNGDFMTKVFTFVAAQLSIDWTGSTCNVRLLDDATEQYTSASISATVGGIALPRLPDANAIVTPYKCVERGRSFRGSKHFGPVPTASVTKDELNAGAVTAWGVITGKLLLTWTSVTGSYAPIVLSKTLSQLKTNPTTIIGSDVNAVLLNKTIGTMRRRKEKTVQ